MTKYALLHVTFQLKILSKKKLQTTGTAIRQRVSGFGLCCVQCFHFTLFRLTLQRRYTEAERGEEKLRKGETESTGKEEGNCVPACRRVCVCVCVCACGGRHALAGFSITQLPLIFNCFLRLAHSSTSHSVSRKEEDGLPSRGEGKERWRGGGGGMGEKEER